MKDHFWLPAQHLAEIALQLKQRIVEGLEADGCEIKCLITYARARLPQTYEPAVVVDIGGTSVRAALVRYGADGAEILEGPVTGDLPVVRGALLEQTDYLGLQTDLVARLQPPSGCPLGYCFSYPAAPSPDGDAVLINWTKEIFVPGVEGKAVGKLLLSALAARGIHCSSVAVVNDTVASLLAGLTGGRAAGNIGLIVGTGTNMAPLLDQDKIPKFPSEMRWGAGIPINLETGNFTPPYLTRFDDRLDTASDNPGRQRFEKAVSGVYLGRLLQAAMPHIGFDPESGSRGVVELASSAQEGDERDTAKAILTRSARLTAACLAGLSSLLTDAGRVHIVAEGGLFWGAPGYAEAVSSALSGTLERLGKPMITPEITRIENANLLGTAIAALNR
jgi:hexokinase